MAQPKTWAPAFAGATALYFRLIIHIGPVTTYPSFIRPTVTFDVVNLNKARRESYFPFTNAQFTSFNPGRTFKLGVRGKF